MDQGLELDEVRCLREQMLITLKHLKAFHLTISSVMIDVAAIRRTILNTPKLNSQYKRNLAQISQNSRPLIEEAVRSYDGLIESMGEHEKPGANPAPEAASSVH